MSTKTNKHYLNTNSRITRVSYNEKLQFVEVIKILNTSQLGKLYKFISEKCPICIKLNKENPEEESEILVDKIDKYNFKLFTEYMETLINTEK